MSAVLNFDPNFNYSGNMCRKTVRLTFGLWDYRLTVERDCGGNTSGLSVIHGAISNFYDDVAETGIVMSRADGDTLLCEDDEEQHEEWLESMLIGAEIVALEPQPYVRRTGVVKL